jgi:hypothetical protein
MNHQTALKSLETPQRFNQSVHQARITQENQVRAREVCGQPTATSNPAGPACDKPSQGVDNRVAATTGAVAYLGYMYE